MYLNGRENRQFPPQLKPKTGKLPALVNEPLHFGQLCFPCPQIVLLPTMKTYLSAILFVLFLALVAAAAGPAVWTVDTRSEVLKGDSKGVSIDDTGTITLAPR